jgi:hypothetical protein
MPMQGIVDVSGEGRADGAGEKAGGAGDAGEGPQRAAEPRKLWVQSLQPQRSCERRGQQKTCALNLLKETIQC